jgi:alkyl sulfatase BDS1-like metallo-beta-lactamase superfamily hydrolase
MKTVKLTFSDEQIEQIRKEWVSECSDSEYSGDIEELSDQREALRQSVAREFENRGYLTQAEELREGQLDLDPYVDQLSDTPSTPSASEMLADLVLVSVDGLKMDY